MRFTKVLATAAAAASAALLLPFATSSAGAAEAAATLTAVHGIPGTDIGVSDPSLPVDVLVNGELCALKGFKFGEISPRLQVPAGSYDVEIKLSDGNCGGATAIALEDVAVPAGANASIVAHLDAAGKPKASVFVNDLSGLGLYHVRVGVHHTAAAPAVDVDVTRAVGWTTPFISLASVKNGDQGVAETWVGNYRADIAPAGSEPIFSAPATFIGGRYYAVYAVGSVSSGTFRLIVDTQLTDGASH